jgi:nucleoside-diphosphate-sugar epimerase
VWDGVRAARAGGRRHGDATNWERWWELGAFVHLGDLVDAVVLALTADVAGHVRLLLAADDAAPPQPPLEMLERLHPGVPVRDPEWFARDSSRSLVDTSGARRVLGWQPAHHWRSISAAAAPR